MKKMVYVLISLFMFLPLMVFADMSSPVIKEYDVTVNNPDGVYAYTLNDGSEYIKTNKIIPYGEVITVNDFELEIDGFASYEYDEENDIDYYVKLKDTVVVEQNYKVKESELAKKEKAIVLKDVEIKKGPANAYESTGTKIRKGEIIDVRFFRVSEDEEEADYINPFAYVEYKGIKGFITSYGATIAYNEIKDESIVSYQDMDIMDANSEKSIGLLKANTILKDHVYHVDDWSHSYYIEYNGIKGLIYNPSYIFISDEKEKFTTNFRFNVYESLVDDMEHYESKLKIVGKLDKDTTFYTNIWDEMYGECRIYISNDKVKGWIYAPSKDIDDENSISCYGLNFGEDDEEIEEEQEDKPKEPYVIKDKDKINNKDKIVFSTKDIIVVCISAALIISLTALVIILLVNKKKKEKK